MQDEATPLEGGAVLYRAAGSLAALERAASDDAIRAVVIRGNGRAFSAGGDLVAVAAGEDVGHPVVLGQAIWNLAKPVIAAVHGYCLGQACEVAGVCDLTVAARSTTFGEMFDAELAVQIGLVNRVVDDNGLDAEVARIADRIAGLKPEAVAANKMLVNSRYESAGFTPWLR